MRRCVQHHIRLTLLALCTCLLMVFPRLRLPTLRCANLADSHIAANANRLCAVIDNLVKGASGQAIQNMNLLFGLPEETALLQQALFP